MVLKRNWILSIFATMALVLTQLPAAQAGPFDKFKKAIPGMGGDETPQLSAADALDQQAELMEQVTKSLTNLASAQTLMAEALGLKEEAAIASQNATDLEAGGLTGSDDMEKRLASSDTVTDAIEAKMAEGEQLSDESKKIFASSLPPYGVGSVGMVTSAKSAATTASNLTSSADPQILAKMDELKSIVSFGKAAPSIISGFKDTTGSILKFAQANNIDTSELEADIADW
ncbi:MAG: hypothetical protein P8M13_03985 [Luminiphilus sp.]|nr:hypothetical protein [Luminiphilus sp.]